MGAGDVRGGRLRRRSERARLGAARDADRQPRSGRSANGEQEPRPWARAARNVVPGGENVPTASGAAQILWSWVCGGILPAGYQLRDVLHRGE